MRRLNGAIAFALLTAACAAQNPAAQRERVIGHALESTVQLFTERGEGVTRAGSGVLLTREAGTDKMLVLTAGHLVQPPTEQTVYALSQDRTEHLPASILAVDPDRDLALVEVEGLDGDSVTLLPQANLGDRVWVVAFPWGRERTVVSGVVSQVDWIDPAADERPPVGGPVRLIDASVSYGMSGGGIFSHESGALIGLVRGYRSAELSFPGTQSGSLRLPVAGETTVISAPAIQCFLRKAGATDDLAAALKPFAADASVSC